ncbi:hypothetical protein PR048_012595 [Dryococelus australis]|uniref:Uncharacterized protein n=1 Tax=Dryococelus australis TaxID=614101 RepID=A0ABQ9HPU6_9NEOP|nr:hypothetical protein PR048_012595 [Dryococelus australis]
MSSTPMNSHRLFPPKCSRKHCFWELSGISLSSTNILMMTASLSSSSFHVALPNVMFPNFDGDSKQWSKFRNLFSILVIKINNISQEIRICLSETAIKGEALGMVHLLPMYSSNFSVPWKL